MFPRLSNLGLLGPHFVNRPRNKAERRWPLDLSGATRKFTAHRDEFGVPHVQAADWETALYALGFLHATDRPTQLLFSRVVAQGESARHLADRPALAETDRYFRRVGLHLNLEAEVASLPEWARRQLTIYCDGVNDAFAAQGRPIAVWAAGYQPPPWDVGAVLLIGNLLNFGGLAVNQQQSERLIVELIHAGVDEENLKELFGGRLDGADFDLLKQVKTPSRLSDKALEMIGDLPRLAGSNAWAVAPKRSETGHALVAGDPHLEVNRLPAIWYEAVLNFGDQYLMGATLPGTPTVAVGRTKELGWSVTYVKGDTSDYFVEDVRRGPEGAWQYRRGESWRDFQLRAESIEHKRGTAEEVDVLYNDLATLEGDPNVDGEGYYLSTAWSGSSPGVGQSVATWLSLVHAPDVAAAMEVVRECPQPTLCWVFADRAGHIGSQVNGRFPIRREGHSGLFPVPAWDERNRWYGWAPTEALPRAYDPPEGFLASANEDIGGWSLTTQTPTPVGEFVNLDGIQDAVGKDSTSGGSSTGVWCTVPLADYRKRRIVNRLRELPRASVLDMQRLQYDVISEQARDLLPVLLPHLPEGPVKESLSGWDGNYEPTSREATLFGLLYRNVLLEIFGVAPRESGGIGWRRMLYLCSRAGFSMMILTATDRLLMREHSRWWAGRDKGQLIRRAAEKLETELRAHNAPAPWAKTNAFSFTNRFFENRFAGRALGMHTGEYPMRGCFATPFQGHLYRTATHESTFAPSYHFVADLGTDEAHTNLPGGPSESPLSRWYKCDISRWLSGGFKKLQR